jgi:alanyl-tRNA synthetase
MNASEIRWMFLDFFSRRGHAVVRSSSLIPDDPSVLLTTAGMQQFKKYYTGEADALRDFGSRNTASCQKSFRTSDIDEVGDERHLTFFEMLGNFSFGGYGKREAIAYAFDFIAKEMNLPISYVTVFEGSRSVPRDEESAAIWKELGVSDVRYEGMEDVFWGPTGSAGPCGPTTEIYVQNGAGQNIEVWNIVFNQFFYPGSREELLAGNQDKKLEPLTPFGVDTGMGLERLVMCKQGTATIFETDLLAPLVRILPGSMSASGQRVAADHARAIAFLVSDGVRPSNKGAGYILRRLMRRLLAQEGMSAAALAPVLEHVCLLYGDAYAELDAGTVVSAWNEEAEKFAKTIDVGKKELARLSTIRAQDAFRLYESYGLPYEAIKELAGEKAANLTRTDFDKEFARHQEVSRAGAEKKFGGHGLLLDTGELKAGTEEELKKVTRLHTATHLLQQALRDVLGPEVAQRGSDITVERTRFDFSFNRKVTAEELARVERIVNEKAQEDLPVSFVELPIDEAKKTGALYYFREKYPALVKVYFAGSSLEIAYSKEFCGGPHVTRTSEVGKFKIIKEEAVSAGIRRIRAIVE